MYVETFRIGGVGILHVTIGFGISKVNLVMSIAHCVTSSFTFSGVQRKENSDLDSFSISISFLFNDETVSFVFSISEFQKKDSSETDFVRGDTGESMSFMEGVICSDTTC